MINASPIQLRIPHDPLLKELESTVKLDPSFMYPQGVTTPLWACALDFIDKSEVREFHIHQ